MGILDKSYGLTQMSEFLGTQGALSAYLTENVLHNHSWINLVKGELATLYEIYKKSKVIFFLFNQ